jgi:hypothetical protein
MGAPSIERQRDRICSLLTICIRFGDEKLNDLESVENENED